MAYSHTPGSTGITDLFDENGHSEINMVKCLKLDYAVAASASAETLHVALPTNSIVIRAYAKITVAETTAASKVVDIGTASGTGGDADGFIVDLDFTTLGTIQVGAGALLNTVLTGDDAIQATPAGADFATGEAEIYLFYIEV